MFLSRGLTHVARGGIEGIHRLLSAPMRRHIPWFCSVGLVAIACGTEQLGTTPMDTSSSDPTNADETSPTEPDDESGSSTIPDPDTSTSIAESSSETTETPDTDATSTTSDESSTGVPTTCGNGIVDDGEMCDGADVGGATCIGEGFESGTLVCADDCSGFDTSVCGICGNGDIDGDELCDGSLGGESCVSQGFDSGSLECGADCYSFDTSACGECGNAIIDGTEICDGNNVSGMDCEDLNYDSGSIGCASNCTGYDFTSCGVCGNGIVDGEDVCDGAALGGETCQTQGFDSGSLACDAACGAFVTAACGTCGDGILDPSETCDSDLLDGESCESLGLVGGNLACSASCQYDVADCDIPGIPFGSDGGYSGYALQLDDTACDDISGTGTPLGLFDDDSAFVDIGWVFPVYGVDYAQVSITSNGSLHFGEPGDPGLGNDCLPTFQDPSTNNLHVFWDDLNTGANGGEIYYQSLGMDGDRRFVVQWDTAHFGSDGSDPIRIQAMLQESTGQIIVCYPDATTVGDFGNNGAEATSGIQQDSDTALQFSCNTADIVDGLQLLYIPG